MKACLVLSTGWLSRSGEFVECHSYEHIYTAGKIASRYSDYDPTDSPDVFLNMKGWVGVHLSLMGTKEWTISMPPGSLELSVEQKQFLSRYLEDTIPPSLMLEYAIKDYE